MGFFRLSFRQFLFQKSSEKIIKKNVIVRSKYTVKNGRKLPCRFWLFCVVDV
nr:MAG TPA: hypothetical protein [Caudoviricetes sp.]